MDSTNDPQSINRLIADMMRSDREKRQNALHQLSEQVLPEFRSLGVHEIEVSYSGYGDSGAIDGIQYRGDAGVRVERETVPPALARSLEDCVYELLPAGFEINDGGQGVVLVNTLTKKATIQHQENYTETRDTTEEFTL